MFARELVVLGSMAVLLFFWLIPISTLAGLLSYKEIKKAWPALARIIDANPQIAVIVQNSLPSVAVISLNACLPFILEGKRRQSSVTRQLTKSVAAFTYMQGYRARSWIEYSLLKKYVAYIFHHITSHAHDSCRYFLFLLVNVVFIFLFVSTYWQLVRDLANSPAKIPEKLAAALQQGNAR